jgi:diguanylate cyclase (GGDEF)-like protein
MFQNTIVLLAVALGSAFIGGFLVHRLLHIQIKRLKKFSNIDSVTGLYASAEIDRFLEFEVQRVARYGGELSLVLFEIDDFDAFMHKHQNYTSHYILQQVSNIILKGVAKDSPHKFYGIRNSDMAFRYVSSGKFLIMLPETHVKGAKIAAERIKDVIMYHEFDLVKSDRFIRLNISSGVVGFDQKQDNAKTLLQRAELMLSKAQIVHNTVVSENPINNVFPLFKHSK